MAYNLTQNQKDIAIWLVRKVKGGELQEEIEIRWNGYEAHEGEVIFPFERRADSEGYAGRIYDHLAGKYGRQFSDRDVHNIGEAVDFGGLVDPALNSCI